MSSTSTQRKGALLNRNEATYCEDFHCENAEVGENE